MQAVGRTQYQFVVLEFVDMGGTKELAGMDAEFLETSVVVGIFFERDVRRPVFPMARPGKVDR